MLYAASHCKATLQFLEVVCLSHHFYIQAHDRCLVLHNATHTGATYELSTVPMQGKILYCVLPGRVSAILLRVWIPWVSVLAYVSVSLGFVNVIEPHEIWSSTYTVDELPFLVSSSRQLKFALADKQFGGKHTFATLDVQDRTSP